MKNFSRSVNPLSWAGALLASGSIVLSGCGGGESTVASPAQEPVLVATGSTSLQLDMVTLPDAVATQLAQPYFHAAPALLADPGDADAMYSEASANQAPRSQTLSADLSDLSTRRLTVQDLQAPKSMHAARNRAVAPDGNAVPMAAGSTVTTYTPAQIRAAYGLPALPTSWSGLSATQAAQMGAGQTIYIVDAQHNPNAAAELAAFNQKFGLPACTTKAIAATAALPLGKASATACEFSVVYNTATGGMTGTAPAYNAGWATEIALDVQWAHATAPLARIVLIESADASLNSLLGGIKLANAMGPGIVSMSFGALEGNWTASVDSAFTAANMTYLAATGDSGAAVSWPSVSPNVVAVGGTTLSYSGTGTRSEIVWSGTGGGVSAYTPAPSYQTNAVPGLGTVTRRAVADVAFNADPASGQYVAVMTPGATTPSWMSVGGTSLSTPQWAGLIAIANATRALSSKPALGSPHAVLYGQISTVPGTYASVFADITKGSDGTCALCTAKAGYDVPTGLGTPNVSGLLSALAGTGTATAPVVTGSAISAVVGTPLSFTTSVSAVNPVTYTLSGAPAGMAISSTGVVTWPTPVVGTYAVTVIAKDSKTGLSGQGVYSVAISAISAPVVNAATINGKPGSALSYTVVTTAPNPVSYTLSGAPAGMAISSAGVLSWASPVLGSYNVTVIARDSKTGLSGQGVMTVKISAAGPVITAGAISGVAGKPLTGTISISDPGATSLSVSISGVPLGMGFSGSGFTLTANWPNPIAGNYSLKVTVVDGAGLSAQATVAVTVSAK
jgi:subtilase family serine protease